MRFERKRIIARELLVALGALVVFPFAGQHVLRFLGISEPSLSLAGGTILFIIVIRMIFPRPRALQQEEKLEGEPFGLRSVAMSSGVPRTGRSRDRE